ncbi:hypothetical protein A8709_09300 [Paenibacillus pectinilyticus]|uniref:Protein kinase domain-containing protein n=1 Tax=Paenibacillus pectinilyticus TaxID=512399 RepID=A0A1C1A5I5_9BACL|nr:hypothetical protein [Paenibacillus pectinilyticus]OCT15815.1 hypothetical protein A8709_09300 [Paenibacillus pectinilyticus]
MQNRIMAINSSGKNVPFGKELGRGGEGSVFEISSASKIVAKVYHQALQPKKQEKILTMVRLHKDRLLKFSTWPLDVLKNPNNEIIGFIMPKLTGKEIHKLYGPKTRLIEFPYSTYPFLVHTAANLARAFAAVHESGHVIGDVNHGNFYVSDQGTVMLVDCDSFQIKTTQDIFRCEVGIPMYQPPELQNVSSYRDVERNSNHDNFGLAVFIFMLLFMGRHPFAGVYSGPEDMPIEKAIGQFRFAYGSHAAAKQMKPPPGAPSLTSAPPAVVQLFERAFAPEGVKGNRPSAEEWIKVLGEFSGNLQKCRMKEQHHYSKHLSSCPWCDIENKIGIVLFLSQVRSCTSGSVGQQNTFEIKMIWARIAAVSSPPSAFTLPDFSSAVVAPSQTALKAAKKRKRMKGFTLLSIIAVDGTLLTLIPQASVWIIIVSIVIAVVVFQSKKPVSAFKESYEKVKKERDSLISRWAMETGAEAFYKMYHSLENIKSEYQNLDSYRNSLLKELQSKQRDIQLQRYLQSIRIANARIDGIGSSRTATLQSFGIETAGDISKAAIRQVPGFGPSFTKRLLDWRDTVARQFVFNPKQAVSTADIATIDRDISIKKQKFEQQLLVGASQLQQLSDQINSKRTRMLQEANLVAKNFAQAEADYKSQ